jgi:uncharacterized membrane protein
MSASSTSPRRSRTAAKGAVKPTDTRARGRQAGDTRAKGQQTKGQQANARAKSQQAADTRPKGQPITQGAEQSGGAWPRFLALPRSMGGLQFTTLVVSVLGLADSGYQVYTHFSHTGLAGCSAKTDACVLVQSSTYAFVFGIPVAVLGLAFFAFMVAVCSPPAWRSTWPAIQLARVASVVIGIVFVLYLIYREVITLGQICAYCTSVHVLTFILFALIVFHASAPKSARPR